ncbi:DUF6168 family protein [Tenacibaculum amylolyticum]|uniref:DUF6168 family protein n=1 Tax=Tenacibaculum amylolyticum TaxID=104269 RepID=UPI003894875C
MIKRIVLFFAVAIVLFLVTYFSHQYILSANKTVLSFSLSSVYLFHVIAASLIYVIIEFVAEKLPTQAGYAYLASIFLKMGFFVLIFNTDLFGNEALTKPERISLVIPLFVFLITEAIAVSKLLNSK